MVRSGFLLGFLFAVAALFGGCTREERREVRMGYFPNVTHAPALVGLERGDWAEEFASDGTPFRAFPFNAGPSVIEAMMGGNLDIAYVGPSPTLNAHLRTGGEMIRVVSNAVENGVAVVGSNKRGITTLEQLRGGRVATPQLGNTQDISARYYIMNELGAELGRQPGQTMIINASNPDIQLLFQKDELDAAWVPEPWAARMIGEGLVVLIAEEADLWETGRFTITNVIVRTAFLEANPDLVERFLRVHVGIVRELQAERDAFIPLMNDHFMRVMGRRFSEELLADSLSRCRFEVLPDINAYERFLEKGRSLGMLLENSTTTEGLIDDTTILRLLAEETAP